MNKLKLDFKYEHEIWEDGIPLQKGPEICLFVDIRFSNISDK